MYGMVFAAMILRGKKSCVQDIESLGSTMQLILCQNEKSQGMVEVVEFLYPPSTLHKNGHMVIT